VAKEWLNPAVVNNQGTGTAPLTPVVLWGLDGANYVRAPTIMVPSTDNYGTFAQSLLTTAYQLVYRGDTNWDRQRTPVVFKPLNGVAVATETAIWTPAAGKRFRLMGFVLAGSVAGNYVLRDNTAGTIILVVPSAAGAPVALPPLGNGILSAAANNVLTCTGPASSTLSGFVYGTEE
jgi:hypothetical protein